MPRMVTSLIGAAGIAALLAGCGGGISSPGSIVKYDSNGLVGYGKFASATDAKYAASHDSNTSDHDTVVDSIPSGSDTLVCTVPASGGTASFTLYADPASAAVFKPFCSLAESFGGSTPTPGPSKPEVESWPAKWCTVQIGMTRAQVKQIMGQPTSEFGADTSTPQASWSAYDYDFTAFFDINDNVKQLDVNDSGLTPAEKAGITCAFTRTPNGNN